jgi:hypothetical protein
MRLDTILSLMMMKSFDKLRRSCQTLDWRCKLSRLSGAISCVISDLCDHMSPYDVQLSFALIDVEISDLLCYRDV